MSHGQLITNKMSATVICCLLSGRYAAYSHFFCDPIPGTQLNLETETCSVFAHTKIVSKRICGI